MSVLYDATTLRYAVVEYLKRTSHIYDPVDTPPTEDSQYRIICLAPDAEEASRIAHLLSATGNGRFHYSISLEEPAGEDSLIDSTQTSLRTV